MGRRKKFGEESGFVNVRVPKSKVSEYRDAIKKLVEEKFSRDSQELKEDEEFKGKTENESVVFRDFREFGNNSEKKGKNKLEKDPERRNENFAFEMKLKPFYDAINQYRLRNEIIQYDLKI